MTTNVTELDCTEHNFAKITECRTWPLYWRCDAHRDFNRLFDHGFVADRACIWGGPEFDGVEIAIVSRTYDERLIDLPYEGIKCVRLTGPLGDTKGFGTAIATFISGPGDDADAFIQACCALPADMLAYAMSLDVGKHHEVVLWPDGANGARACIADLDEVDRYKFYDIAEFCAKYGGSEEDVSFDQSENVFRIGAYEIDADRCRTPEELLVWILHLSEKRWINSEHLNTLAMIASSVGHFTLPWSV